ncbi:MAG: NADH-quinone oxidoreductase subunit C [Planctomycetota bacterium]
MALDLPSLLASLKEHFGDDLLAQTEFRGQHVLRIRSTANLPVLRYLRDEAQFEMLTDVTCVDSLRLPPGMQKEYPERFAVVYQLYSLTHNERLRVKAFVPEEPCEIDSVTPLWEAANWGEREVFDMFGVVFKGHPDLKRILMPDNYTGHPLRKDYPLKGRGERDRFQKYTEMPER